MTDLNLNQAREWADSVSAGPATGRAHAAAKIIQSLPDRWVDAEKLREAVDKYEGIAAISVIIQDFAALLAPKLPTLADMSEEEREACQWMQAKIPDSDQIHVIANVWPTGSFLWRADGHSFHRNNALITPLPDLPKLEWPGNEAVEQSLPEDERIESWEEIASHKFFDDCYRDGVLLDHMLKKLDYAAAAYPTCWPALPEGMRLADHKIYGRVVVSPGSDSNGLRAIFYLDKWMQSGVSYGYAKMDNLTFLDSEA